MKKPTFKLLAFFAIITLLLIACSDDSSATAGGGTETDNAIAQDTIVVQDTIIKQDTIIQQDTLIKQDTIVKQDTIIKQDTILVQDSSNIPVIQKATISGAVQKGPFVSGASVYIYELDGENLVQTGKSYRGKTGENGEFKLTNISLDSKYALLEATGFYINEVTGKKSESQVTMTAIADVSGKETININFLTHLEYDRVMHLVTEKGITLSEAKKQAEKEIISTFFGDLSSRNFEELNIFGTTDDDAKLLALSVLVLANDSDAQFSELLSLISTDLETDGSYDNETVKAGMADFAAFFINTPKIRNNMKAFNKGSVPDFEKFIYAFWVHNYGLGECDHSNESEIKKNQNEKSNYHTTNFECSEGKWAPYYFNPEYQYGFITDERDGKTYRTTKIGEQVWMAENLRFDGNGHHCYNDDEVYCKRYGYYYTYDQIACPKGWHLPDTTEWRILFDAVGGADVASKHLKSTSWSIAKAPGIEDVQDEFGFSVLPAGVWPFGDEGNAAFYYTSSTISRDGSVIGAWVVNSTSMDEAIKSNTFTTTMLTARCLQDP